MVKDLAPARAFHPKRSINRKTKLNIVFDPEARREFLTGFHKRKLQRKKKAQEQLQQQLKEEKKRLKQDARDAYKKLVVSHRPIPELEDLYTQEYELDNHTVNVVELSTLDLAQKQNWIGENKVQYEEKEESECGSDKGEDELPGMELKTKKDIKKVVKQQATKQVQKSKAFQIKNKMEQLKMKKKSLRMKKQRIKQRNKSKKGKHKSRKHN